MSEEHYDLIVIGGGSAGYAGVRTACDMGKRVAVVDSAEELGGLCILRGCMPSKTLIYSAEVLHHAQKALEFGLDIPEAKVDIKALHARKKKIIGEFQEYREEQLLSGKFKLYRSYATFLDENSIELSDGTVLKADYFLISTGSIVSRPDIKGLSEVNSMTSDEILDLDTVPESVIVLGGGIIACELGQFLQRIGSRVIQIQRSPRILKKTSQEAAEVLEGAFRDEGIELYTGARIELIEENASGVSVKFEDEGVTKEVKAKHLFNALGREANTKGLELQNAGVETLKSSHIKCNEFMQTSKSHIYAAGDCTGPHEIVHVAILQAELAIKHAFNRPVEGINYDHLLKITFTDPQIGEVGLSEQDAKDRGIDCVSASYPFDDHGKSILMEAKYGYVKVIARKSDGVVIGAECVGVDASELIHSMSVAISLRASVFDLLKTHWYHPTLSEIWTYPLEDIAEFIKN